MPSPFAATIHDSARQAHRGWFLLGADALLWRSGHPHSGSNCAHFCVSDDFSERALRAAGRSNLAGPPWQVSKRSFFPNCTLRLARQSIFVWFSTGLRFCWADGRFHASRGNSEWAEGRFSAECVLRMVGAMLEQALCYFSRTPNIYLVGDRACLTLELGKAGDRKLDFSTVRPKKTAFCF